MSVKVQGKELTCTTCHEMGEDNLAPYGPLKNVIQRSNPDGANQYLVAIHPENPYTFKPLLKRLVCVECHGSARKVSTFTDAKGRTGKIPLFYGKGAGTLTRQWAAEVMK
ncbi:MAG: hypothetical protein M0Z75_16955 [Nitrospiraceae bacterium]|nr:hypothetical protein [Nitrospiraceae bacterium]